MCPCTVDTDEHSVLFDRMCVQIRPVRFHSVHTPAYQIHLSRVEKDIK